MSNEVLEYVGLELNKENENLKCTKPEYNITKSYDNYMLYKVYKNIPIKDIQILISYTDRTTEIKERYLKAKPINKFIKENDREFEELVKQAKVKEIDKIDKQQKEFSIHTPYFVRYEKNYLWQIYYSKVDNKYFMLFPAREGETDVLFYLIKKKIENSDEKIYVPICKEDYSENLMKSREFSDIENYILYFTKEWPQIYEVEDKIYITGSTKIKEGLESKYRIEIKNQEEADSEYTLFKALFILATETNYKFEPCIDDNGRLRLEYENEILQIDNLTNFIKRQANKKKKLTQEFNINIKNDKQKLEALKKEIDELIETYRIQEKQIVMFLNCKNSFFKKLKFYFKKVDNDSKFTKSKSNKDDTKHQEELESGQEKREEDQEKKENEAQALKDDVKNVYNLSDLVKICKANKNIEEEYKKIKADINAMKNKKKTFDRRVQNAQNYLDEIEKHKKSIFEFWKFAKKDENLALKEGEETSNSSKLEASFNIDEDLQDLSLKADSLQKRKLSIDECNSIFACKYILNSINSIISGKNEEKILSEELNKLKSKYSGNRRTEIFGDIEEDYTKTKNLNNKKHRENRKNIYSILGVNGQTSIQEYKDTVENLVRLLNEAYKKITAITDFPVYYTKENKDGYTIAEINPRDIKVDELKEKSVYKLQIHKNDNILYFSNIIHYDNFNQTLPTGMDETTSVLIKVPEILNNKETVINVVEENGLYDIKINKIKVIE